MIKKDNMNDILMILGRTDLDFALNLGTVTRFSHHDIPASNMINLLRSVSNNHAQHLGQVSTAFALNSELQSVTSDVFQLATLLNDRYRRGKKIHGHYFHDTVIWIGYRLVHLGPLDSPRPIDGSRNMLHLGLIAFMANFLAGLDRKLPRLPQLASLIRTAIFQHRDTSKKTCELALWILAMGKSTTFTPHDDEWVLPEFAQMTQILNISTAEDLRQTLSKYPWVNILHDNMAQTIWTASTPYRNIPPLLGI
jgi:hypothetical protein